LHQHFIKVSLPSIKKLTTEINYQKSNLPPNIRTRDNQRNFRARRKELIADLQRQLREYEQREIQATVFVQNAAKKVVWENSMLRALLDVKGVGEDEIDNWLRKEQRETKHVDVMTKHVETATQETVSECCGQTNECGTSAPLPQPSIPEPTIGVATALPRDVMPVGIRNGETNDLAQEPYVAFNDGDDDLTVSHERDPIRDHHTMQNDEYTTRDPTLEMSCETAASIIVGMQKNTARNREEERQHIRWQLGCGQNEQCNVKNSKVLQVMDME
jgi:hypothetical protein